MRAGSAIASGVRHATSIGLQAFLVAAIVVALVVAVATAMGQAPGGANKVFAAKGGKGNAAVAGSFIRLDQSADALSLGSRVTFTADAVGLANNEYPLIYLKCVQGDKVVYGQLDTPDTTFVLGGGSSPWWSVGGKATCEGQLRAYGARAGADTIRTLATTEQFSAN
jgi:hypothetical protein